MSDYCCQCQENAERIWEIGDDLEINAELHEWIHGGGHWYED